MRSSDWYATFATCALFGIAVGYLLVLLLRPSLLPPFLRFGGLTLPETVLFLGTDVVYSKEHRALKADPASFQGNSDTIMLVRLDPIRNCFTVLSVPRDTEVRVPGYGGVQKANAANAFGGPRLAERTISNFLGVPIDHYVVLNVHGLVELIDEIGGIDVDIPKRMHYSDNSAKLHIDLQPGIHHLNGTEAMGFVRFRHDSLGDIGRVQRQQLFLQALKQKALDPFSFAKLPRLLSIAQNYLLTDMDNGEILRIAAFVRAVPKENQQMIMLPGRFAGNGDWATADADVQTVVSRFLGQSVVPNTRHAIRITVENATNDPEEGRKVCKYLSACGYTVVYRGSSDVPLDRSATTRIIAQRGNTDDARMIKEDLSNRGDIINASVGDIDSAITIIAGSDLGFLTDEAAAQRASRHKRYRRRAS